MKIIVDEFPATKDSCMFYCQHVPQPVGSLFYQPYCAFAKMQLGRVQPCTHPDCPYLTAIELQSKSE